MADNYIIRIYRRDTADPRRITGVVELVEREEQRSFTGIEEIVAILASCQGEGPGHGKGQRRRSLKRKHSTV